MQKLFIWFLKIHEYIPYHKYSYILTTNNYFRGSETIENNVRGFLSVYLPKAHGLQQQSLLISMNKRLNLFKIKS